MKQTPFDTIAAISTPPGEGGIGIVRVSGDDAIEIVLRIFHPYRKPILLSKKPSFSMTLGMIRDGDRMVDEVLVSIMKKPHTYTREDVVEVNCHGGALAVNEVLKLVLAAGARLAQPGEFTQRAYINGRIDLLQAEAVLDIVRAKTYRALEAAVGQLEGRLSEKLHRLSDLLRQILVILEANIDFAEEEDIASLEYDKMKKALLSAKGEITSLLESFETGRIYKEGVFTVIVGKPNVGKSSIMNAFLKFDRAIVTPIPGTTRDVIEEQLNIEGVPFILADTAGITDTDNIVEKEGVHRSKTAIDSAGLLLVVFDNASEIDERDLDIARRANSIPHITVVNKVDLQTRIDLVALTRQTGLDSTPIFLSAKYGTGLKELESRMLEMVRGGDATGDYALMVTSRRHFDSLRRARIEIENALEAIAEQREPELVAFDVKSVVDCLGEITGKVTNQEVLESIFSDFCIGK
jgi:tRNA modification GTPase